MPKIVVDGITIAAAEGETILKAAEGAGIAIPHFCFHPAFPPEGSCRMCVIEVEGCSKLELACATEAKEGMIVRTGTDRVREARRAVLEFLLTEHPLDCPVCDKAGECRLQDYFQEHGLGPSRFNEAKTKRAKLVPIGNGLLLDRERCILCTRCVRFLDRVTRTRELGVFERGNRSEVGTLEDRPVATNYAGNLVDVCPVGAITDLDFRFTTRAWFLKPVASFCPLCGRGCEVWIDEHPGFARTARAKRIFRVRPKENPDRNGPWLCDTGRRAFSSLDRNRTDKVLCNEGGRKTILSWDKALLWAGRKLAELSTKGRSNRIAVVLNSFLSNEELYLAGRFFRDSLQVGYLAFLDPPLGIPDGFLLTSRRSPNRRGARELGFDLAPPDWDRIAATAELLLLFAHPCLEVAAEDPIHKAWSGVRTRILLTPRTCGLEAGADLILPTALTAEKAGSWTDIAGSARVFEPVLETPGDGVAEWRILAGLAQELRLEGLAGLESFARVRTELVRAHPCFEAI